MSAAAILITGADLAPQALDLTAADGRTPLNAFYFAPQIAPHSAVKGRHPVLVLAYGVGLVTKVLVVCIMATPVIGLVRPPLELRADPFEVVPLVDLLAGLVGGVGAPVRDQLLEGGAELGAARALGGEHRGHVVGHPLAMHPLRRRERAGERGMVGEEARVGAQEFLILS